MSNKTREETSLNLISNLAIADFDLVGEPFVDVTPDKAIYYLAGDTITIWIDAEVPYDLTADVYVVLLGPGGQFWSPLGFGEAEWVSEIAAIIPGIALDGGFTFSGPAFMANLPADVPFDAAGGFTLFTALVEPGTLTPLSDIGMTSFTLQ